MFEGTDRNYQWLCATLVSAGVQLPVVESVFMQQGQIALWVYSTKSGKIKKRMPHQPFDASLPSVLRHFQQGRYCTDSDPICTALIGETRTPIFLQEGQTPLLELSNTLLQATLADSSNSPIYTLRLNRQNGAYSSSFSVKVGETVKEGKSLRLWCKCSAVGKVVLEAVKRIKKEVVVSMELELVISPLGDVLLYGCSTIAVQGIHQDLEPIANAGQKSLKKRNLSRLLTPASVCPKSILRTEEPTMISSESTPQLRATPTILPKIGSSHHNLDFENPHFKEILARTYARTRPHLYKANIDEIFSEINHDYFQEKEPCPKPTVLIIPRRSRYMSFEGSVKRGLVPVSSSFDLSTTATLEPLEKNKVRFVKKILRNFEEKSQFSKQFPGTGERIDVKRSQKVLQPARLQDSYLRHTMI